MMIGEPGRGAYVQVILETVQVLNTTDEFRLGVGRTGSREFNLTEHDFLEDDLVADLALTLSKLQ